MTRCLHLQDVKLSRGICDVEKYKLLVRKKVTASKYIYKFTIYRQLYGGNRNDEENFPSVCFILLLNFFVHFNQIVLPTRNTIWKLETPVCQLETPFGTSLSLQPFCKNQSSWRKPAVFKR